MLNRLLPPIFCAEFLRRRGDFCHLEEDDGGDRFDDGGVEGGDSGE